MRLCDDRMKIVLQTLIISHSCFVTSVLQERMVTMMDARLARLEAVSGLHVRERMHICVHRLSVVPISN